MNKNLFAAIPIMLELQFTWMDKSLPDSWWNSMNRVEKCDYHQLLLTDVNQNYFKSKIPFGLEEFSSHIALHAKEVREGLSEHWLTCWCASPPQSCRQYAQKPQLQIALEHVRAKHPVKSKKTALQRGHFV